jgi:hypothetical protein
VNVTTIPAAPSRIIPANSKRTRCWEETETASPLTSLRSISISRSLSLSCITDPHARLVANRGRICQAVEAATPQLRNPPAPAIPRNEFEMQKAADVRWLKWVIAAEANLAKCRFFVGGQWCEHTPHWCPPFAALQPLQARPAVHTGQR